MRVLAFSFFLRGPINIGTIYFRKNLDFHKEFIFQLTGTLTSLIVSVVAAIKVQNVWAFAYGMLAGNFVLVIVSYVMHPYRPHLRFDRKIAGDLFGFGKWVMMSSVLVFLLTEGDDVFAGKLVGTAALGLYQMAYRISNLPATELAKVVNQVAFPAFSKLQMDVDRLRKAFLKSFALISLLSVFIAGEIFALSYDFTYVFLGKQWIPMVSAMRALAIWGVIRSLGGSTSPVLLAIGRPKLITLFQAIMLLSMALLIYPLTLEWGILGTALAVVFANLSVHWLRYPIIAKAIHCRSWEIYRLALFPIVATIIMVAFIFALKANVGMFFEPSILGLLFLGGIGGVIYIAVIYLYSRFLQYDIIEVIAEVVR